MEMLLRSFEALRLRARDPELLVTFGASRLPRSVPVSSLSTDTLAEQLQQKPRNFLQELQDSPICNVWNRNDSVCLQKGITAFGQ